MGQSTVHLSSGYAAPQRLRARRAGAGAERRGASLRGGRGAHDPRHVAAAVQWYLYGSDGHGAARMEDKADRARKDRYRNLTVSA